MKSTQYLIWILSVLMLTSCTGQDNKYKQKSKAERDSEKLARSIGLELKEWEVEEDYYRANSNEALIKLSKEKPKISHLKFHHSNRSADTLPLPNEIGKFQDLTHLVLYSFNTDEIPAEIGKLSKLTYLTIRIPSLKHIPAEIGQLKNLKELIISFADGTETISSKIFTLPNLEKLALRRFHQKSIEIEDDAFKSLVNLKELIIGDTRMKIPKSINQLRSLKILDLGLYYGDVPKEVYELKEVETLKLYSISEEEMIGIGNMTSVRSFQLMNGNTISSEISKMKDLTEFTIWETYTDEFPIELSKLQKLKKLKIVGTSKFKEVPEFVYNLKGLEELSLVGCDSLNILDDRILNIPNLNQIILERNKYLKLSEEQKLSRKIKN